MGQTTKALVQLVLIICILASIPIWVFSRPTPSIWYWRIALAIGIFITGLIWYRWAHCRENLPDLLAQEIGSYSYFERDGLCFAPVLEVVNGVCWLSIYFQNKYANPCSCQVQLLPPRRAFWVGRHNLPPIEAELNCPGGAFGVSRRPYPVDRKYQGRRWRFDVYGNTHYPQGKGQMLRFRDGIPAGSTASFTVSGAHGVSTLHFPRNLASTIAGPIEPMTEILWQPDLPTMGFPVIPTTLSPTTQAPDHAETGFQINPEKSR